MRFLMVLPVVSRSIDADTFATESAFARHLIELRESMADFVDELVVAGVGMSDADFANRRETLGEVRFSSDRVRFVPVLEDALGGHFAYWRRALPRALTRLVGLIRAADIVSAGPDAYAFRPLTFPALLLGVAFRKATLSTTDIDHRRSGRMMYESGLWSSRTYLMDKLIHAVSRELQHRIIVRGADLVMLKGEELKASYGPHRGHVKVLYDTAFAPEDIISEPALEERVRRQRAATEPLRLIYFGRFVDYKGVDHMIRAVAACPSANVTLSIIGQGPEEARYRAEIERCGVEDRVAIEPPLAYGAPLFERVRQADLLLAAPLHEDTPRSLWDAFAAGVGVVAYDTSYYAGLAGSTGAVTVVPWNDVDALAARLAALAQDRAQVAEMSRRAVAAARGNSQDVWLARRADWVRQALRAKGRLPAAV